MKYSFLSFAVAFVIVVTGGISFAAWIDAPNAPPNYGIIGCTPPCTQEDFKPMNLGTTDQTKRSGATFEGGLTANNFVDRQDSAYFIDPQSPILSGVFNGAFNIDQTASGGAKLVVNNSSTDGKTGASGDAIYAYTNTANAAISAEQANPAGYAVYSSGGINYFNGEVRVGSAASPQNLCLSGVCQSTWPSGVWTQTGNDIYNTNSGNVGIGTTAPGQKLQIENPGATSSLVSFSHDNAVYGVVGVDSVNNMVVQSNNVPMLFSANGFAATHMAITASGNVGIGTTAPTANLHVEGNTRITGDLMVDGNVGLTRGSCVWRNAGSGYDIYFYCGNNEYVAGLRLKNEWTGNEWYKHQYIPDVYCCAIPQ